jgi:leucyl/phenylalanyl-tRNA--protein transferase
VKKISSKELLHAYSIGLFPMAESHDNNEVFFVDPNYRGIIPLDKFHTPRKLRRLIRKQPFKITCDTVFEKVLDSCAKTRKNSEGTWINREIKDLYIELFNIKSCHSVEIWLNEELVGGLYGVALGGAFFGESMFSRVTNASKVALVYLVAKLRSDGFSLLDSQFLTNHLAQFGAIQISRIDYHQELQAALKKTAVFTSYPNDFKLLTEFLQSKTQMS